MAVRIAAAGDIHISAGNVDRVADAFRRVASDADMILLAGDLTSHGQLEEAQLLADICRPLELPIVAVLGNHDWHSDRAREITTALTAAGVTMIDRSHAVFTVHGTSVGVTGAKGFIGGFGSTWANFGEPLFRQAYAETTADVEAIDAGLAAIAGADVRVVLLHYSPCAETLEGEPERLWLVLGADRLGAPIHAHRPDLVVHGHAHHGSFEGCVDTVPVYNVAVHVTGRDFWIFELEPKSEQSAPVAVEEA
jgi:Icc-related predicted phosphoesterase